jgi:hypothetical protein
MNESFNELGLTEQLHRSRDTYTAVKKQCNDKCPLRLQQSCLVVNKSFF